MKTCVIFHNQDLDGWMSAAIVKYWYEQKHKGNTLHYGNVIVDPNEGSHSLTLVGYNYGQPIPDLSEYDKVIMCDISFPKEEMRKLFVTDKGVNKLIWMDHHISAIKENQINELTPHIDGLRDTKFAACELTWKYFFPNEEIPEIVRLLGLYDSFRHKGTDEEKKVLEFQYGARQCISNYEEAYNYLKQEILHNNPIESCEREENPIYKIWNIGKAIYQYLCTEAKQTYKNGFEVQFQENTKVDVNGHPEIDGIKFRKLICINKERFNPINFGIDYHKEGYDGAACFHYANGMWNFSIYNDNGLVDCSVIAKQYGGGGHKGASGFRLSNEDFLKLINQ